MSDYKPYIIYTFKNIKGGSAQSVRAKPMSGQGLNETMHVSCSKKMRLNNPIGSYIKLDAKVVNRVGEEEYLYSPASFDYEIISEDEAKKYIADNF